jgi:hypothetical protein
MAQFAQAHQQTTQSFSSAINDLENDGRSNLAPDDTATQNFAKVDGKDLKVELKGSQNGTTTASLIHGGQEIYSFDATQIDKIPAIVHALEEKSKILNIQDRTDQMCGVLEFQAGYENHGCASAKLTCDYKNENSEIVSVTLHTSGAARVGNADYEGDSNRNHVVSVESPGSREVFSLDQDNCKMLAQAIGSSSDTNHSSLVDFLKGDDSGVALRTNAVGDGPADKDKTASNNSGPIEGIDVARNENGMYVVTLAAESGCCVTVITNEDPRAHLQEIKNIENQFSAEKLCEVLQRIVVADAKTEATVAMWDQNRQQEVAFNFKASGVEGFWANMAVPSPYAQSAHDRAVFADKAVLEIVASKFEEKAASNAATIGALDHRIVQDSVQANQQLNSYIRNNITGVSPLRTVTVELDSQRDTAYKLRIEGVDGERFEASFNNLPAGLLTTDRYDAVGQQMVQAFDATPRGDKTVLAQKMVRLQQDAEPGSIKQLKFTADHINVDFSGSVLKWNSTDTLAPSGVVKEVISTDTAFKQDLLQSLETALTSADATVANQIILDNLKDHHTSDFSLAVLSPHTNQAAVEFGKITFQVSPNGIDAEFYGKEGKVGRLEFDATSPGSRLSQNEFLALIVTAQETQSDLVIPQGAAAPMLQVLTTHNLVNKSSHSENLKFNITHDRSLEIQCSSTTPPIFELKISDDLGQTVATTKGAHTNLRSTLHGLTQAGQNITLGNIESQLLLNIASGNNASIDTIEIKKGTLSVQIVGDTLKWSDPSDGCVHSLTMQNLQQNADFQQLANDLSTQTDQDTIKKMLYDGMSSIAMSHNGSYEIEAPTGRQGIFEYLKIAITGTATGGVVTLTPISGGEQKLVTTGFSNNSAASIADAGSDLIKAATKSDSITAIGNLLSNCKSIVAIPATHPLQFDLDGTHSIELTSTAAGIKARLFETNPAGGAQNTNLEISGLLKNSAVSGIDLEEIGKILTEQNGVKLAPKFIAALDQDKIEKITWNQYGNVLNINANPGGRTTIKWQTSDVAGTVQTGPLSTGILKDDIFKWEKVLTALNSKDFANNLFEGVRELPVLNVPTLDVGFSRIPKGGVAPTTPEFSVSLTPNPLVTGGYNARLDLAGAPNLRGFAELKVSNTDANKVGIGNLLNTWHRGAIDNTITESALLGLNSTNSKVTNADIDIRDLAGEVQGETYNVKVKCTGLQVKATLTDAQGSTITQASDPRSIVNALHPILNNGSLKVQDPSNDELKAKIDSAFESGGDQVSIPNNLSQAYTSFSVERKGNDELTLTLQNAVSGDVDKIKLSGHTTTDDSKILKEALTELLIGGERGALVESLGLLPSLAKVDLKTAIASAAVEGFNRTLEIKLDSAGSDIDIKLNNHNTQGSDPYTFEGRVLHQSWAGIAPVHSTLLKYFGKLDLKNGASLTAEKKAEAGFDADFEILHKASTNNFIIDSALLALRAPVNPNINPPLTVKEDYRFVQIKQHEEKVIMSISHQGNERENARGLDIDSNTEGKVYEKLEAVFGSGMEHKLCKFSWDEKNQKDQIGIRGMIGKMAESYPPETHIMMNNLSAAASISKFNPIGIKIEQMWLVLKDPDETDATKTKKENDLQEKNREVFGTFNKESQSFNIFIGGELNSEFWGGDRKDPNNPTRKPEDLYKKRGLVYDDIGLVGRSDGSGSSPITDGTFFDIPQGPTSAPVLAPILAKVWLRTRDAGASGTLERELVGLKCDPKRYALGLRTRKEGEGYDKAKSDFSFVEFRAAKDGILDVFIHPDKKHIQELKSLSTVQPRGPGRDVWQDTNLHTEPIHLELRADTHSSASDIIESINKFNVRMSNNPIDGTPEPPSTDEIYRALMKKGMILKSEVIHVSKVPTNTGGEVFRPGRKVDECSPFSRIVLKDSGTVELKVMNAELYLPGVSEPMLMRLEHYNEAALEKLHSYIAAEVSHTGDKKLSQLTSLMIKQGWTFNKIPEGCDIFLSKDKVSSMDVKASLGRIAFRDSFDYFKGTINYSNNAGDTVVVQGARNLSAGSPVQDRIRGDLYNVKIQTNTTLHDPRYFKENDDSWLTYERFEKDPAQAVYDALSMFENTVASNAGGGRTGNNQKKIPRRHVYAGAGSELYTRVTDALNDGLKIEAKGARISFDLSSTQMKELSFDNLHIKDSFIEVIVQEKHIERIRHNKIQEMLDKLCKPFNEPPGSPLDKGNSVDLILENVDEDIAISNVSLDTIDYKSGKRGKASLILANVDCDNILIGQDGNVSGAQNIHINNCLVRTLFSIKVAGGGGIDPSVHIWGSDVETFNFDAATVSCDLRTTSFRNLRVKGCDVLQRKANWDDLKIAQRALTGLRLSMNLWNADEGDETMAQSKRNMRRILNPFDSIFESIFDRRGTNKRSIPTHRATTALGKQMDADSCYRSESDKKDGTFTLGRQQQGGVRVQMKPTDSPDKTRVEVLSAPTNWLTGLVGNPFDVNAVLIAQDLPSLANNARSGNQGDVEGVFNRWKNHGAKPLI